MVLPSIKLNTFVVFGLKIRVEWILSFPCLVTNSFFASLLPTHNCLTSKRKIVLVLN